MRVLQQTGLGVRVFRSASSTEVFNQDTTLVSECHFEARADNSCLRQINDPNGLATCSSRGTNDRLENGTQRVLRSENEGHSRECLRLLSCRQPLLETVVTSHLWSWHHSTTTTIVIRLHHHITESLPCRHGRLTIFPCGQCRICG